MIVSIHCIFLKTIKKEYEKQKKKKNLRKKLIMKKNKK